MCSSDLRVTGMDRRLAEAARLGFTTAVVPTGIESPPRGLRVLPADNITAATIGRDAHESTEPAA